MNDLGDGDETQRRSLRNAMMRNCDQLGQAMEEIALEGLDGITIEALWTRLSIAFRHQLPFGRTFETSLWERLRVSSSLDFYKLPTPRAKLLINEEMINPERNDNFMIEYSQMIFEVYPFQGINDKEKNIIGSCSTYNTRIHINEEIRTMDLDAVNEIYGNSLVIVASQQLRNAVLSPRTDISLLNLSDTHYYILECIGRSRKIGQVTGSNNTLMDICRDPKTLHYFIKTLIDRGIITKQMYVWADAANVRPGCRLLHLQKFFDERRSRKHIFIESFIKMLKVRPNYRMEYAELRRIVGNDDWDRTKKIIKSSELKQFVHTDVVVPYREMYPNATTAEWKRKNNQERTLRVLELINPNVNVNSLWKDDDARNSSSDEENIGDIAQNSSVMSNCYELIVNYGPNGIFIRDIQRHTSLDFYTIRAACRTLQRRGVIDCMMIDQGKQRMAKYVSTATKKTDEQCTVDADAQRRSEAIDFIAGVLNVERECLEKPREENAGSINQPQGGRFQEIRDLRMLLTTQLDVATKEDIKQRLREIYSNKHCFEVVQTLPAKKPHTTECFQACVRDSFKASHVKHKTRAIYGDVNVGESTGNELIIKYQAKGIRKPKLGPVLKMLFGDVASALQARNYKFLIQNMTRVMHNLIDSAKEETFRSELSSSEDEIDDDDVDSLDINLEDGQLVERKRDTLEESNSRLENFESESLKRKEAPEISSHVEAKRPKLTNDENFGVTMEIFMGPKPVLIRESTNNENVNVKVVVSSEPSDFAYLKFSSLSDRVIARTDFVKNCIQQHKCITDFHKMHNMLMMAEKKEGNPQKIDRKSIFRIYRTLVYRGELRVVKLIATYEGVVRTKNMLIAPDADIEALLQGTLDQFVHSFSLYAKRKKDGDKIKEEMVKVEKSDAQKDQKVVDNVVASKVECEASTSEEQPPDKIRFKYSRYIGKTYGLVPKFAKMRQLHEFLFYLVYDYSGSLIEKEQVAQILMKETNRDNRIKLDEKTIQQTDLYKSDISWKMFIAPLPTYKSHPSGWIMVGDALLRLPISIFVKIFNIPYIIPEFQKQYLNHPIKKHYLVRMLPTDIRNAVLSYRKYIHSIHEIFQYLAYMGLVQFGSQKYREKDQLFLYLNRNGLLYDTTSSEIGYHQISEKTYPEKRYRFDSEATIQRYWNDMFMMSLETKLGIRSTVLGKSINVHNIHAKDALVQAIKAQTPESASEHDVGYLPGDGLGACCVDSAFWVHVKRNWIRPSKKRTQHPFSTEMHTSVRKKVIDNVKQMNLGSKDFVPSKKHNMLGEGSSSKSTVRKKQHVKKPGKITKVIVRKVLPKMKHKVARIRFDEIDRNIRSKMGKCRATFCKEEDDILVLCKIIADYLCPNSRKRVVLFSTIRDFIHRTLPHSRKTAAQYRRRATWLKKSDNIQDKTQTVSTNLLSDYFTQKHFKRQRDRFRSDEAVSDLEVSLTFLYLAYCSYDRYCKHLKTGSIDHHYTLTDYLVPEVINKYTMMVETVSQSIALYKNPKTEEDILLDNVKSIIHSSLSCQNTSSEYLLKIYQIFPETLLRSALILLRDQQLVSSIKCGTKHSADLRSKFIISGALSYRLSFTYTFNQITKYPSYIFNEVYAFFAATYDNVESIKTSGKSIENFEQGHGLALSELATCRNFSFLFDLPQDIITLDPNMQNYKELVKELGVRYRALICVDEDEAKIAKSEDKFKNVEDVFESFIKSQIDSDRDASSHVEEHELPLSIPLFNDSDNLTISSDRRQQKGLRVSDMAFLLTKGLLPELDDDERLERLNRHFIVKYPSCKFKINDDRFVERENDAVYQACYTNVISKSKLALEKLKSNHLVKNSLIDEEEISRTLHSCGANDDDKLLANSLIHFIYSKDTIGATAKEVVEKFSDLSKGNLTLSHIVTLLCELQVILCFGIAEFTFVHFYYRHNWTIFIDFNETAVKNENDYRVKLSPWIRVNGELHIEIFNNWLEIILSYCLSYPFVMFTELCKRFCYIKPVDIYTLLEFLEVLTCISIMTHHNTGDIDLFNDEYDVDGEIAHTMLLDDWKNVFVETDYRAAIKFGSYLSQYYTSSFSFE